MNNKDSAYKKPPILLLIFVALVILAAIKPFYLSGQFQINLKPCLDNDGVPGQQLNQGANAYYQKDCLSDYKKSILDLYIFGLVNIDELTIWVLGVDRRVVVLKTMHKYGLIKASDIAEKTGRSLQNISHGIRELEERGLIKCITPEKHTWKRFILTEKGMKVFEKLKENHLIS